MCSCCRYPVFDYLMGRGRGSFKEGIENARDAGTPGSEVSVKAAANDAAEMIKKKQPVPDVVTATSAVVKPSNEGMKPAKRDLYQTYLIVVSMLCRISLAL